ncbi:integral membrane protein-like protein [Pseudovirgaria hyperparasitica]|uniref:Integral membrane protein-like protein n=1 Tax=Pseudovirgaria hyperparasitica TaxID=470096 RepID=A0A6A6W4S4_9PEZI|nr:integral membrane protein-like protein [Pseudovirgaria hyperparasitica]KAF2757928.1 integral membrane protein-like protein [Pseudovirgaria hyperparasitica]
MVCVRDCDSTDPNKRKHFEQPVLQTLQMFIGEMGCWLVVGGFSLYQRYTTKKAGYEPISTRGVEGDQEDILTHDTGSATPPVANPLKLSHEEIERIPLVGWKIFLLAAPAVCDITGTTLMNVGLLFVAASIYQMTRGALVLFVGLFSVLFLKRVLGAAKWLALFIVVAGVALVGLAGAITRDEKATPTRILTETSPDPAVMTIIGILCIAGAQIFTASQFVLEESIMEKYEMEPLKVVGWEGIFGFLVTGIVMGILHAVVGQTDAGRYGYFDAREGFREFFEIRSIAISSILIMISIGGFNFFGLSVTRTVSATSRSTIDTCRTLFIWIVSLGLGWETFKWLQVVGFALLVYGTFLFNDIIRPPLQMCMTGNRRTSADSDGGATQPLLAEDPIEHR